MFYTLTEEQQMILDTIHSFVTRDEALKEKEIDAKKEIIYGG